MNCSQPVVIDDSHVLFSSSDAGGAALLEISETARHRGKSGRTIDSRTNSIRRCCIRGIVYGFDESILACMDPKTGELKWKGGRYGFGQVLLAGDYLVITTEQGEVVLVRATPEGHQELARFSGDRGEDVEHPGHRPRVAAGAQYN